MKMNPGDKIEINGERYDVIHVCRGEGHANTIKRRDLWYEVHVVEGQWIVAKKEQTVPDYFFD